MNPNGKNAQVRVFMPTYRRNELLKRAVASLRAQTFADWVCELHNDDPHDPMPARLLAELGDPRFILCQHEQNLGGTGTFNLFFKATVEPFYSILEDDNFWEPDFLATMIETARHYPEATVFWCNQRFWQQRSDGSFEDLKRCAHEYRPGDPPRRVAWGQAAQIYGAVHANGAALLRSRPNQDFSTPLLPFEGMEWFRERMLPHPMVFVPAPLANFSITLQSHRSQNPDAAILMPMITASFLKYAGFDDAQFEELLRSARKAVPPLTNCLIFASLIEPACRPLRRHTVLRDWLIFLRSAVGHFRVFWATVRCRRARAEWWDFLDKHTAARRKEAGLP